MRGGYSRHHGLPAGLNRHTGKPHLNTREQSRRQRQAKRDAEKRLDRAVSAANRGQPMTPAGYGRSRRGRKVTL